MDVAAQLNAALVGRYHVERPIGAGGMATVYLARDVRHDRLVAVKVLEVELAMSVGAERFLREIETAARLQHPHILPIYESGGEPPLLYYVMPYVEGESLRERMQHDGRLTMRDALRFGLEIAEALSFSHGRNVVHRDIKPENVLLFRGHAMVADFGIAKVLKPLVAGGGGLTTDGGFTAGTPMYMSPEQTFGDADIDGRTDQYSLACVMFEMLTGEPPFRGPSVMAVLARKHTGPAPVLSGCIEPIPDHVCEAIRRALAADVEARFPSIAEFADALTSARGGRPLYFPADGTRDDTNSLAILPFVNTSAPHDDDYLSDGITEDLIHAMSSVRQLRVVARTSSFAFKGQQRDARAIGTALGVGTVLEGSVRRAADRLRITAQLVDVGTGAVMWSERYDRQLTDVFEVQDAITRSIADALKIQFLGDGSRLVRAQTDQIDAYEAYLLGRFHWNRRTEAGLRRSLGDLQQALQADPCFALAHAALAQTQVTLAIYGVESPHEVMPRALASADAALRLQPRLAEALTVRASVRALYEHDWRGAEEDFLAAIEAGEAYPTTHQWYAMHCLAPQRRFAEARTRLARARELDPLSSAIGCSAGILRYYERDYEQAIAEFDLVLARDERFALAHYFRGLAATEIDRHAVALDALARASALGGESSEHLAALGYASARAGDAHAAHERLAQLDDRGRRRYVSPVLLAQVHAALGERGRAVGLLDVAVRDRATELPMLAMRPAFDGLHGHPRFERIVQGIMPQAADAAASP